MNLKKFMVLVHGIFILFLTLAFIMNYNSALIAEGFWKKVLGLLLVGVTMYITYDEAKIFSKGIKNWKSLQR